MFVDASAIVAVITAETDADTLADTLAEDRAAITSPIAIFEAVLGICRKRHTSVSERLADVDEFLATANVGAVPITREIADAALDAFSRFGKGRGHPAQLNMGDCFAYAAARSHRTTLLYKGDDFRNTDIADAAHRRCPGGAITTGDDNVEYPFHARCCPDRPPTAALLFDRPLAGTDCCHPRRLKARLLSPLGGPGQSAEGLVFSDSS